MSNKEEASQKLEPGDFDVRRLTEADTNFVIATWLKSYLHKSAFAKRIKHSVYFKYHHEVVHRILTRPSVTVWIACSKEDPHQIFGYIVREKYATPLIHFVYVKPAFRKFGIGSHLLGETGPNPNDCEFTHFCYDGEIFLKKYPDLTYNPYLT